MSHFDSQQLLIDAQHGFGKSRPSETKLILQTIQDLANGFNRVEQIDAVLLDAFDKVPHQHLLEHYGVQGHLNNWISDFLADKRQEVVSEGVHSKSADVTSGVPQGTSCLQQGFLLMTPWYIESYIPRKTSTSYGKAGPDSKNGSL